MSRRPGMRGGRAGSAKTQPKEEEDGREDEEDFLPPTSSAWNEAQRRKREKCSPPTELMEQQMMDLALRLSQQEACTAASKRRKEEQEVLKALQDSMASQSQPCASSQSQSMLDNTFLMGPSVAGGDDSNTNRRKRRCKDPDSQVGLSGCTQGRACTQEGSRSPRGLSRPQLQLAKLSQEVLNTCLSSGFVHSQEELPPTPPQPQSPLHSDPDTAGEGQGPRSPVFGDGPPLSPPGRALLSPRRRGQAQGASSGSTSPLFGPASQENRLRLRPQKRLLAPGPLGPPGLKANGIVLTDEDDDEDTGLESAVDAASPVKSGGGRLQDGVLMDFSSDAMTLHWSDEEQGSQVGGQPSPVFPGESPSSGPRSLSQAPPGGDKKQDSLGPPRSGAGPSPQPAEGVEGGATVHYYWGVPFCPRGGDPDAYTQVIVTQMQVYQSSLRRAQRCLLKKAPWAEPVVPPPHNSPSPEPPSPVSSSRKLRRGLRQRHKAPAAEEEEQEEQLKDEEQGGQEVEEEEEEGGIRGGQEEVKEEKGGGGEEEQEDCIICPETPPSVEDDITQHLTNQEVGVCAQAPCPPCPEEQQEEQMELDEPGSPRPAEQDVVMEEEGEEPRSPAPTVACPLCQEAFSAAEIETHAAYCDGEAPLPPARGRVCRKRTRRGDRVDRTERCYVCHSWVPLRDFPSHTEQCLMAPAGAAKGDLLSALEKTDNKAPEAGTSRTDCNDATAADVIDLRFCDDDSGDTPSFRVPTSPIRAFTSISQATDCLVDFRRQRAAREAPPRGAPPRGHRRNFRHRSRNQTPEDAE